MGPRPACARLAVRRNADRVWAYERRKAEQDATRNGRDDRQDSAHGMPPGNRCFFTCLCRLTGRDSSLVVHRRTVSYTAPSVFTPSRSTTLSGDPAFAQVLSLAGGATRRPPEDANDCFLRKTGSRHVARSLAQRRAVRAHRISDDARTSTGPTERLTVGAFPDCIPGSIATAG